MEPDVGQTRDSGFLTVRAAWLGDDVVILGRGADETGPGRLEFYASGMENGQARETAKAV